MSWQTEFHFQHSRSWILLRVRDSEIGKFAVMNVNIKTELCKTSLHQWDSLTGRAVFFSLSTFGVSVESPGLQRFHVSGHSRHSSGLSYRSSAAWHGEDQPVALVRSYGSPGCACLLGYSTLRGFFRHDLGWPTLLVESVYWATRLRDLFIADWCVTLRDVSSGIIPTLKWTAVQFFFFFLLKMRLSNSINMLVAKNCQFKHCSMRLFQHFIWCLGRNSPEILIYAFVHKNLMLHSV